MKLTALYRVNSVRKNKTSRNTKFPVVWFTETNGIRSNNRPAFTRNKYIMCVMRLLFVEAHMTQVGWVLSDQQLLLVAMVILGWKKGFLFFSLAS